MNNEPEIQKQVDEEINLLDIFTILLRYRKLIMGITVFSAILAVAGYFVIPAYQYKKAVTADDRFQGKTHFSINTHVQPLFTQNLDNMINDADIIFDSLRNAGMNTFKYGHNQEISLTDEAERIRALYIINEILVNNKTLNGQMIKEKDRVLQVNSTNNSNNQIIEVLFKNSDVKLAESFIQSIFILSNERLKNYIRPNAYAIIQNYEQLINNPNNLQYAQQILAENYNQYIYLKNVLEGRETILLQSNTIITESVVTLDTLRDKYLFYGIILVFFGFMIAVFIAFVLNGIRKIRNDDEAMKKIHDAMGNSTAK